MTESIDLTEAGVDAPTEADTVREEAAATPTLLQLLREDLHCVRLRDPAARGELESLLTYPGVHAVIWHRLSNRLWRRGWRFPARFLSWLGRFLTNVDIHPGATIGRRFFIDHGACVVIGETAEIGDDVTLYHGVTLGGTTWSPGKRHPTLENDVVVGAGAKILGPITVGRGTRVGANSVVIDDVPGDVTVVGIPAKVVHPDGAGKKSGRIDLNHHFMPDPVSAALAHILDRVDFVEARVGLLQRHVREGRSEERATERSKAHDDA